jgi:hypothetical protein
MALLLRYTRHAAPPLHFAGESPARGGASTREGKNVLFEKKNQKMCSTAGKSRNSSSKSFLLLFFKKEGLAYFTCAEAS